MGKVYNKEKSGKLARPLMRVEKRGEKVLKKAGSPEIMQRFYG